jgi:hypothetical protein
MNRSLSLIALASLTFSFVACSSSDDANTNASAVDGGIDAKGPSQPSQDSGTPEATHDATSPPADGGVDASDADDASDASTATSPYGEACSASSMTCTGAGLTCKKFSFGGGAINGYACSQTCKSDNDCAASPAGMAASKCLQFTSAKYCVLACDASKADSCPAPLKCAADQGAATGICVNI